MRRLTALIAALALFAAPAQAQSQPQDAALGVRLDAMIDRLAPAESQVGVSVVGLDSGRKLYERQANKLFTPASLTKLITAAASLSLMGAQRRFATRLLAEGPVVGGTLRGRLYLKGEGDPTLEAGDLEALAAKLRAQGVTRIAGDLVLDTSYFAPEGRGADGWSWDDLIWGYAAPVNALTLHRNAVDVTVAPGKAPGAPLAISFEPDVSYVKINNRGTTLAKAGGREPDMAREAHTPGQEAWRLTGGLPVGAEPAELSRSVSFPTLFAGSGFADALARRGVKLSGKLALGPTPGAARTVAVHWSPPLADIVHEMNKESDNLLAETLLFHTGMHRTSGPGTWSKGLAAATRFLGQAGWKAGGYRLADGSGLSRYNALSPSQLTQLLRYMPAQKFSYPAFLISLPVSGVDGTLSQRLGAGDTRGRLRAKTGTMGGVSGLAGYLDTPRGETLAIAVMVNGFVTPPSALRKLQDELVAALVEPEPPTP